MNREPCTCKDCRNMRVTIQRGDNVRPHGTIGPPDVFDPPLRFCPYRGTELKAKEEERFQWEFFVNAPIPGSNNHYPLRCMTVKKLTEDEATRIFGILLIRRVDESREGKG